MVEVDPAVAEEEAVSAVNEASVAKGASAAVPPVVDVEAGAAASATLTGNLAMNEREYTSKELGGRFLVEVGISDLNASSSSHRGVKHVDKRDGGGSHNWGTYEDEMKAAEDKTNVSSDEINPDAPERSGDDQSHPLDQSLHEEEPKTMTLDEWKASQEAKKGTPKFNLRKAGEGAEQDPQWKKTYAYKKEKETAADEEEEEVS